MYEQEIFIISQRDGSGEFPNKLSKVVTVQCYGCGVQFFEDIEEAQEELAKLTEKIGPFYSIFRCNIQVIEKLT